MHSSRRSSRAFSLVSALAVLSVVLPAAAQDKATLDRAKAEYQTATADYDLGRYDEALKIYESEYTLLRRPAFLFNIAQCHRQLKQFDKAAIAYRSYIRLAPDSPQMPLAQNLLAQVEQALQVADKAQAAPPTGPVASDEGPKTIGALNKPAEPKPVVILAKAASPVAAPASASAPRNATRASPSASSESARSGEAKSGRLWTWVAAGAAVGALGGGAFFAMQANSTSSQVTSSSHQRADLDSLIATQSQQAGRAKLLFGVGAGLAIVAGTLWVLRF